MTSDPSPSELPAGRLLAYAMPALPLAVLALPFYVLVPAYYATALAIPLAVVGQALLAVRIVDAISDPVVGLFADRLGTRLGRRRTWMAFACPVAALGAVMLLAPPAGAGAGYLLLWGLVLSVGWTALQVPYGAWGAELSRTYHGRTRVAAFRETLTVVGTLLALSTPAALAALGQPGDGTALRVFAWAVGAGLPLCVLVAVTRVPEPADRGAARLSAGAALRQLAADRPFLRLLAAFFVNGLANGLPATLFVFFVTDRLKAPDAVGPLLLVYFIAAIAGVPVWLALARRLSKHRAWALGMMLAIAAFAFAPALGAGEAAAFGVIAAITGFCLGADVVLPASLQADVIEARAAEAGEARAGLYLSVWTLATKLALAGAVGVAFPVLAAAGYDPARSLATATGLAALAALYAGVPSALKIVAVLLVWRFPLARDGQNPPAGGRSVHPAPSSR